MSQIFRDSSSGPTPPSTFVQQVQASFSGYITTSNQIPDDDTIPQITEGDPLISLSITPISASSILFIQFSCFFSTDGEIFTIFPLFKDSGADAVFACGATPTDTEDLDTCSFNFYLPAASTSAQTFSVRYGAAVSSAGNIFINGNTSNRLFGGVMKTVLIISEVQT